jgi:hypothetical protein
MMWWQRTDHKPCRPTLDSAIATLKGLGVVRAGAVTVAASVKVVVVVVVVATIAQVTAGRWRGKAR